MKKLMAAFATAALILMGPALAQTGTTTTTTTVTSPGTGWTYERSYSTSTQDFDWDDDRRERFRNAIDVESRAYDEGFRTYETEISTHLTPAQRARWGDLVTSDRRYITVYSTPQQRAEYETYLVTELDLDEQQRARVIPIWRRAISENEARSSRYTTEQEVIVRRQEIQTFRTNLANNNRTVVRRQAPARQVDTANTQPWDRDNDMK